MFVHFIDPGIWQLDFESTQERKGKQHKNTEEDEVHPDVCREVVEAKWAHDSGEDETKSNVNQDDRSAINQGFENTFAARFGLFGEESNGHWNHWEHTRRK